MTPTKDREPAKTPVISEDLLVWLKEQYPDKCPDLDDRKRAIWMSAGQAKLIRGLERIYEEQQEVDSDSPELPNVLSKPT